MCVCMCVCVCVCVCICAVFGIILRVNVHIKSIKSMSSKFFKEGNLRHKFLVYDMKALRYGHRLLYKSSSFLPCLFSPTLTLGRMPGTPSTCGLVVAHNGVCQHGQYSAPQVMPISPCENVLFFSNP